MKKTSLLILSFIMTGTVTASAFASETESKHLTCQKMMIQTKQSIICRMPNPCVNYKDIKDAAKITGFDITVPDTICRYGGRTVQVICDKLIEVTYKNGDDELSIRKAEVTDDISGDYCKYTEINTVDVGALNVTMKGSGGKVNVATWTDGSYTYAVGNVKGIDKGSMVNIIEAIR